MAHCNNVVICERQHIVAWEKNIGVTTGPRRPHHYQ